VKTVVPRTPGGNGLGEASPGNRSNSSGEGDASDAGGRVPFARPSIEDGEIAAVVAVLESGWLTTGPRVAEFERRFADYVSAPFAVAVNSCTAGLHLALLASRIGAGDEVITTPLTFCATANVIVHTGATPVFADVDSSSMNLDPAAAAAAVTGRTRALLPVHYAGRPARVGELRRVAAAHGLALVEDAAHCVEGVSDAGKVGSTGDFTAFSFYATKNLTTGEGGMVTTASEDAAAFIRVAALHGMSRDAWARHATGGRAFYDVVLPVLSRLDALRARRTALWQLYDEGLAGVPLERPAPGDPGTVHARHLYTVLCDEGACGWTRDALYGALVERGIGASIHFRAVHLHSYYAERFNLRRGMFPNAESIADRTVSLPFSAAMQASEVARVVDVIRSLVRQGPTRRARG
jgi:dTDP-4-amino-4,6-dideoxygalactose transaminase